jgi:hypothetical protein
VRAHWQVVLPARISDLVRAQLMLPVLQLLASDRTAHRGLDPDHPSRLELVVRLKGPMDQDTTPERIAGGLREVAAAAADAAALRQGIEAVLAPALQGWAFAPDTSTVGQKALSCAFADARRRCTRPFFARWGVLNYLDGDTLSWYQHSWTEPMETGICALATTLGDFEPATGSLEPTVPSDPLRVLYQVLIPHALRRAPNERFTPAWLAELLLTEAGYNGALDQRLLDPVCGFGPVLTQAIRRAR